MYTNTEKMLLMAAIILTLAMACVAATLPARYVLIPLVLSVIIFKLSTNPQRARKRQRTSRPSLAYEAVDEFWESI